MGIDYYSKSGLGIIVTLDNLTIFKKEKTFPHDNFPEDWEVHPKTGKRLWRTVIFYNPIVFPERKNVEYEGLYNASVGGYDIIPLDHGMREGNEFLICLDSAVTDSHRNGESIAYCKIDPNSFLNRFEKFKSCMDQKGLWNDSFGLYSYLKISV